MRKLLVLFLILIQLFLVCAKADEINYPVQNLNKHIEYISNQTSAQKRIYVDFKNYENAVISLCSKVQEIFAQKNSNNINRFFISFINCNFNENYTQISLNRSQYFNFYHTHFPLKNDIYTRAP